MGREVFDFEVHMQYGRGRGMGWEERYLNFDFNIIHSGYTQDLAGRKLPTFPTTSKKYIFRSFSFGAFIEPCRAFPRTPRVYIALGKVWFVRLVLKLLSCCDMILEDVCDWMK